MAYWVGTLLLIVFGFLTGFSIGQPFLLVGLTMLLLAPFRGRPVIFWPTLAAVIAYNVGYWVVAPLTCIATSALDSSATTVCVSVLGLRYEGTGSYNPPLAPAVLAGVASALVTGSVVAFAMWRQRRIGPST